MFVSYCGCMSSFPFCIIPALCNTSFFVVVVIMPVRRVMECVTVRNQETSQRDLLSSLKEQSNMRLLRRRKAQSTLWVLGLWLSLPSSLLVPLYSSLSVCGIVVKGYIPWLLLQTTSIIRSRHHQSRNHLPLPLQAWLWALSFS